MPGFTGLNPIQTGAPSRIPIVVNILGFTTMASREGVTQIDQNGDQRGGGGGGGAEKIGLLEKQFCLRTYSLITFLFLGGPSIHNALHCLNDLHCLHFTMYDHTILF